MSNQTHVQYVRISYLNSAGEPVKDEYGLVVRDAVEDTLLNLWDSFADMKSAVDHTNVVGFLRTDGDARAQAIMDDHLGENLNFNDEVTVPIGEEEAE